MKIEYRRDIDGLRAIAVLGVVFYHFGFSFFGSGYAGVDIFFVISGFLIGGIILDEGRTGTFTFRTFYRRRARRILPALFVMMLVTIPFGFMIMSPKELRYFGGAVMASLMFLSNIWFYSRVDYFNPGAALDPLVHTWSLGVEEQFYFIAPLFLILLRKLRRPVVLLIVGTAALFSLGLMLADSDTYPSAAFYQIQYRAWELAFGVVAAIICRFPTALRFPQFTELLADLGLIAVIAAIFVVPPEARWPGPWTVMPVLGTVLVVLFGRQSTVATRLLSLPPLVWIGTISYSLYLYHQPIHSLAILTLRQEALPLNLRLLLLCATFVLAKLSWRFIEQPFRFGRFSGKTGKRFLISFAAILVIFSIGGHITKGYPQRLPEKARKAIAFEDSEPSSYERCSTGRMRGDTLQASDACTLGAKDVEPSIAIWGDSHAASVAQPIGDALAVDGLSMKEFSLGGCSPIPNSVNMLQLTNSTVEKSEDCSGYNRRVRDYLISNSRIKLVVMYAYWNNYTERRDFNAGNGRVKADKLYSVPVLGPYNLPEVNRLAYLKDNLSQEITDLINSGKSVLIIYPVPEAPFEVPQTYAWALWKDRVTADDTSYPTAVFDDYSAAARKMLDDLGQNKGLYRLDVSDKFCKKGGACILVGENGDVLFRDANHLSLAGSARIAPDIAARIEQIIKGQTNE